MTQPTQREIIEHVREQFGISAMDVLSIMKTPTHPKELRDEFAVTAMASLTSIYWETQAMYESASDLIKCQCESAYEYADMMLKERENK